MLAPSIVALFLSATTLAAVVVPENYNKVYLQSLVDTSFVVQAKGVTTGSTVVVWVSHSHTVLLFINHKYMFTWRSVMLIISLHTATK